MIGLDAVNSQALCAKNRPIVLRATSHDTNLACCEYEVFVAHQFGDGRDDFRCQPARGRFEHAVICRVVDEYPLTKLTHGEACCTCSEGGPIVGVEDESADLIGFRIN